MTISLQQEGLLLLVTLPIIILGGMLGEVYIDGFVGVAIGFVPFLLWFVWFTAWASKGGIPPRM